MHINAVFLRECHGDIYPCSPTKKIPAKQETKHLYVWWSDIFMLADIQESEKIQIQ